jgi:tetratricopeptide (TPR) repeat protein
LNARDELSRLNEVQRLAATGRHAAVVEYLRALKAEEFSQSPTLALIYGTAHARLGRQFEGRRWVETALHRSRHRGDRSIEVRALNASGLIALEGGRIAEATRYFMQGMAEAEQSGDHATLGRCSSNLGVISNMAGDYDHAVIHYTAALAAFQRAPLPWGSAVIHHNLAITYRDRGDFGRALEMAGRAVDSAAAVGDVALEAQAMAGRAEIRVLSGDVEVGRREVQRALDIHRELGDEVRESEDLRILAGAQAAQAEWSRAEDLLLHVIERASQHERPLLAATGRRDLAFLLDRTSRPAEAREMARMARVLFANLNCTAEVGKLDRFLEGES